MSETEEVECVKQPYKQLKKEDIDKRKSKRDDFVGSQGKIDIVGKGHHGKGSGMVFIEKYPEEILNKQYVLTCAHNFPRENITAKLFFRESVGAHDAEAELEWFIYDKYKKDDPKDIKPFNDFAFAVCKTDLTAETELYDKNIYIEEVTEDMVGCKIIVIGYPENGDNHLCYMKGTIEKIELKDFGDEKAAKIIYKDLNTASGNSGSPVYLEHNDGSLSIIGVHHGGKDSEKYNMAAGITSHKLAWMSQQIEKLKQNKQ